MMIKTRQFSERRGFSLMEMILATAILAGSGAALFALIGNGSLYGRRAEEKGEALRLAENLLAEAAAMVMADGDENNQFEPSARTYEEDAGWVGQVTRIDVPPAESLSLIGLAVEVVHQSAPNKPVCRLVRWIRVRSHSGSSLASSLNSEGVTLQGETFGGGS